MADPVRGNGDDAPAGVRSILHVDMDAFFASVEQLDDPSLRGKPVLVGYAGPRGVVAAASYEARAFGCHSAQPMAVALRLCPQAVVRPGRGERYRELSQRVFAIFEQITPLIEPLSIDEAFLDVTGSDRLFGSPVTIARRIRRSIREQTGLTASVGVASNKFLAKLASDWDKPDGLSVVGPEDIGGRIAALPIRDMWGVGPAVGRRLHGLGVRTFGDLQRLSLEQAVERLGPHGEHFWRLARGQDDRPVVPDREAKSVGHEQTFDVDVERAGHVQAVLIDQAERVAVRLRRAGLQGRTVTVKIRFGDFETVTRARTLERATDRTDLLRQAAVAIFGRWARQGFRPVRLIGLAVSGLERDAARQRELFTKEDERARRVDRVTDEIRRRFGKGSARRGLPPEALGRPPGSSADDSGQGRM